MDSLFFYDLETTGFNPRYDRIMQFAGQRTNLQLCPIGQPVNLLIKLTDDILPSPGAILTTGITPQATLADGISEAEFSRFFLGEVVRPGTTMVGYNNIRFDDEFIRHTLWRNFHDPYEWSWSQKRSRWDLLDVARQARALRPEGIIWPFKQAKDAVTGQLTQVPTVGLANLAKANGFENKNAHDALADVQSLINLAQLLKKQQPKLWQFAFAHRCKKAVSKIVKTDQPEPFVYTSGRYSSATEKTTIAINIGQGKTSSIALVWDLRSSMADFVNWTSQEIMANLKTDYKTRQQPGFQALPIKELKLNRCPAVAPLLVVDQPVQTRLQLTIEQALANWHELTHQPEFIERLVTAWNKRTTPSDQDVEGQLYDSFTPESDKIKLRQVAAAELSDLADLQPDFVDERLPQLLLRYKARNYPASLSELEQERWQAFRLAKLQRELPKYMQELARLAQANADSFILQELQLWAESIVPVDF